MKKQNKENNTLLLKRITISPDICHGKPYNLLLVSTGNITNDDLEALFLQNIDNIAQAFTQYDFIEIDRENIIYHQ